MCVRVFVQVGPGSTRTHAAAKGSQSPACSNFEVGRTDQTHTHAQCAQGVLRTSCAVRVSLSCAAAVCCAVLSTTYL